MSRAIRKLYTSRGLKPPDGKGIHTRSFHSCVAQVKTDIRSGKAKSGTNPHAVCMASLGRGKAVKAAHQVVKARHSANRSGR